MTQLIADAIGQAWANFLQSVVLYLPRVLATLSIVVAGWLVAALLRVVTRLVLRRLLVTGLTLVGVSILIFIMVSVLPGDIIDTKLSIFVGRNPELIAEMQARYGLDQPLHLRYLRWLGTTLQGDLGLSWRSGLPVAGLIAESLPITLELTALAMLITVVVGVPLGVVSAVRRNSLFDNVGRVISFAALGLPDFWQGAMMILVASTVFNWFPPIRYVSPFQNLGANLAVFILPAIALGTINVANVMRLTRSSVLEELNRDYVRTARAKGLREQSVVVHHALRNSMINIVTIVGLMTGYLIGGSVTVEAVFTLPGLGRLILASIQQRDFPTIQATLMLTSAAFILINFTIDILYVYLNPRIRYR
jgi:peptide/nickel transport system permease protein